MTDVITDGMEKSNEREALLQGLNERSIALSKVGRTAEAEEGFRKAADMSRAYADDNPETFLTYHAIALYNLAKFLYDMDRDSEAEPLFREALELRRGIANKETDQGQHYVASSLEGLALLLANSGRRMEAEPLFQEALGIRRDIAERYPDSKRAHLAGLLNNYGAMLIEDGRCGEAEPLLRESVDTQCELAALDPEAFLGGLPRKLDNLADALSGMGSEAESKSLRAEAADFRKNLARSGDGQAKSAPAGAVAGDLTAAYRYRDPKTGLYRIAIGRAEAESVVGSNYEEICVHITEGKVDRIVAEEPDAREWRVKEARHYVAEHPLRPKNGLGHAYRYKDLLTGSYELASSEAYAVEHSSGVPQAVWVCYRNGEIDHAASAGEWQEELEVRIGERISEGVSREKLDEFDRITGQSEATRWLEENRPDYREVVATIKAEMEEAIVLVPSAGSIAVEGCEKGLQKKIETGLAPEQGGPHD